MTSAPKPSIAIAKTAFISLLLSSTAQLGHAAQTIDEIIVTAQKREEAIGKVPVSVTAFMAGDIKKFGIDDFIDIRGTIPGVEIRRTGGFGNPSTSIRGVGVTTFDPVAGNTVATYIDDVPLISLSQLNFETFDLARVEVLKGPQGTLFGSNTTAGVIHFITNRPTEEFEMSAQAEAGNYGAFALEGVVSGPVADHLSARISVRGETFDGYYKNQATGNDVGGHDSIQSRFQLLWTSDSAEVLLKGHYYYKDGTSYLHHHVPTLQPNTGAGPAQFCAPIQAALNRGKLLEKDIKAANMTCVDIYQRTNNDNDPWTVYHSSVYGDDPYNKLETYGFSARADVDVDGNTLTSITAFERSVHDAVDPEGMGLGPRAGAFDVIFDTAVSAFSQELRLTSSPDAKHKWVAGMNFNYSKVSQDLIITLNFGAFLDPLSAPGIPLISETPAETLAGSMPYLEPVTQDAVDVAAFTQVDWQLSDRLTAITGVRASWYDKKYVASLDFGPLSFPEQTQKVSQGNVAFRVGLNYDVSDDAIVYATISQGIKSGGFSVQFITGPNQLLGAKQETLLAYEVGFKGAIVPNVLHFNTAAYYYDYNNLQSFSQVVTVAGLAQNFSNVGDAEIYGLEGDITWLPVDSLMLRSGFNYLHTKITDSVDIDGNGTGDDWTGNELQSAPTWMATFLARYTQALTDTFDLVLQYNSNYTGNQWRSADNFAFNYDEATWIHNASLTLVSGDKGWEASVWVRNFTNELDMGWVFGVGNQRRSYNPPRTWGVTLGYKW